MVWVTSNVVSWSAAALDDIRKFVDQVSIQLISQSINEISGFFPKFSLI